MVSVRGRRQHAIDAAAARWVIRTGGDPLCDEERRSLDRWLAESPAHRTAFDRAHSTWTELEALKAAPGLLAGDAVSPRRRLPHAPFRACPSVVAVALRAVAVLVPLFFGAGLSVFWFGDPLLLLAADYRTAPGESRSVTLSDGTNAELNTNSALAVHFDSRERRVTLLAGEAYFTVAPVRGGEARPFVVEAANGTVTALGTQFAVARTGQKTFVIVAEHRVRISVEQPGESTPGSILISAGQSVEYDPVSGIGAVTKVDVRRATAWRQGHLVFDKVRLADVAAELNRYRRGRIVIADEDLAERRVSGVFNIADLSHGLTAIARELKANVVIVPPFVTLLY